jgi:beta-galactosidase GanA
MMQVENEIGMIPEARDYCDAANQAFSENVPGELIKYLKDHKNTLMPEVHELWKKNGFKGTGSWQEVFGKSLQTDEIFMAWYFAKYTNYITEAGKKDYPLPMYVNAALIRPNYQPGQYPSAGPLPHIFDIWRAAAPSIDFFSPDIYFPNFAEWCQKYIQSGNPLFIPEASFGKDAPANVVYAIGECKALGFCPFSIESMRDPEKAKLPKVYDIIDQLSPLILESQANDKIRGVQLDEENQIKSIEFGKYKFNFAHDYTFKWAWREEGPWPRVGCMVIKIRPDEFFVAGSGVIVTFESVNSEMTAGIGEIDEGKFIDGKWMPGRRLSGDQSHQGRHLRIPNTDVGIQRIKLYEYK